MHAIRQSVFYLQQTATHLQRLQHAGLRLHIMSNRITTINYSGHKGKRRCIFAHLLCKHNTKTCCSLQHANAYLDEGFFPSLFGQWRILFSSVETHAVVCLPLFWTIQVSEWFVSKGTGTCLYNRQFTMSLKWDLIKWHFNIYM